MLLTYTYNYFSLGQGYMGKERTGGVYPNIRRWNSFSLIELLIVIAVVAILLWLLLPAVRAARNLGRRGACAANLHSLGQAMQEYCSMFNEWLPGSPNTSGNGADPGGVRTPLYPGYYDRPAVAEQTWPAVHIFDWATPLLMMMRTSIPQSVPERYDLSKKWTFLCPNNQWIAALNHESRINIETFVPSYVTCKFFTYIPTSRRTGDSKGTLFWAHKFVPEDFRPKITGLGDPAVKVFLADGCRVDRGDPRKLQPEDYGYTERGAWVNVHDPEDKDLPSLSYRFKAAKEQAYRHQGGLNLLFFDGHVEYQPEGSSEEKNGFGSGSRQAKFWFPSGTDTRKLPSGSDFSNRNIIVP
jgi:prepilin-type processing-associated H-X9-DG protein